MIQLRSTLALGLLLSLGAFAQAPPPPPPPPPGLLGFENQFTFEGGDFTFVRAEFGADKLVKGSPYSAQAVTEFTQTLADGNRIHRSTTASVARDSEGRTRREQTLNAIGPLATSGDSPKSVMIHDPVAGTTYMLQSNNHSARLNHDPKNVQVQFSRTQTQTSARENTVRTETETLGTKVRQHDANVKSEELGSQTMEGVTAQGKRVTRVIQAGEIGNDRALEVVTETWFSPELQAVVMSKTSDPRSGDTVYKLTNISRAEPDRSLFEVPADFTVTESNGNGTVRAIHLKREE